MSLFAKTARVCVNSTIRKQLATSSIARKSTLTQVYSEKAIHPVGPYYVCYPLSELKVTFDKEIQGLKHLNQQSQAIKANGFVFLSAQLPADEECKLVTGSVKDQTRKMIQNASHVLEAAGSDLEKVVKVNLFVKDFHMLEDINEVYGEYFPQRPARTTSQVPFMLAGADMMMDMVAVVEKE